MTMTTPIESEADLKPEEYGRCYVCVIDTIGSWPSAATPRAWSLALSKLPKMIVKYHLRVAPLRVGDTVVNVLLCRKHSK